MVAYNFAPRLIDAILAGTKDQTIRLPRLRGHALPGQALALFVGQRTDKCQLVLRTVCTEILQVRLRWRPIVEVSIGASLRGLEHLCVGDFDAFARRDGFTDMADMERFWAETHPGKEVFEGYVIRWQAPQAPVAMGAVVALPPALQPGALA